MSKDELKKLHLENRIRKMEGRLHNIKCPGALRAARRELVKLEEKN